MFAFCKRWFVPFFIIFTIFSEQIFFSYLSLRGIAVESGLLQYEFIGISAVAYMILFHDLRHPILAFNSKTVIYTFAAIVFLYYFWGLFAPSYTNPRHMSVLLRFGSIGFSAAILGMHFRKYPCFHEIDCLIPIFVIPFGLIIGTKGLMAAQMAEILKDESGLRYQNVSYYMAEMYSYSAYYIFFSSCKGKRIFTGMKICMFIMMLFCSLICLMSGGRGAFVFIIAVSAYIIYMMNKLGRMNKLTIFIIVGTIALLFLALASYLDLWNSTGLSRVLNRLTEDDAREAYREKALRSFSDSPIIGHGLGAVWWEVGFYSHNMFQDFLVEGGLIGLMIGLWVIYKIIKGLYVLSTNNMSYFFFMLVFLKTFMYTMFSGYWISAYQLWMGFGLIFVLNVKNEIRRNLIVQNS